MSLGVKSAQILGCRLDEVNWSSLDQLSRTMLEENHFHYVITLNGEIALAAQNNSALKQAINQADLVIPDSTNIVWAGRKKGLKLEGRTPGSDYMFLLAHLAVEKKLSLYLLGGRGEVTEKAADRLRLLYPELKIVGLSTADPTEPEAVEEIRQLKPDIVIVAYGAPKQELWMVEHADLPCRLAVGLGGTFDMLAGVRPRAPYFMRRLSLEWLWRLMIQPTRLPRIIKAVIVFPLRVIFTPST